MTLSPRYPATATFLHYTPSRRTASPTRAPFTTPSQHCYGEYIAIVNASLQLMDCTTLAAHIPRCCRRPAAPAHRPYPLRQTPPAGLEPHHLHPPHPQSRRPASACCASAGFPRRASGYCAAGQHLNHALQPAKRRQMKHRVFTTLPECANPNMVGSFPSRPDSTVKH